MHNQVITFKLNSGEEIIAKVVIANNEYIVIGNPVSIAPTPQGMQMVPSLFTSDSSSEITLRTSSISMFGPTDESLANKYIEVTTGIKIPEKKIILG
jgi:hypothetical protein